MSFGRILVTGAGGFIGYNLANDLVQSGFEVTGIDLRFPENPGQGREARFRKVAGDFRDCRRLESALEGADAVVHLASAHLDTGLAEEEYWDVNVRSLPALLKRARVGGVQRFVHISSVGVYGKLAECPANEETSCHPQSIYGRTKLEGERTALEYQQQTGFPVVVLRPAWVYGPGCPRTMKLFHTLKKRRFVMIGSGGNLRHPVFIGDFIAACKLALDSANAVGEVTIVAGPKALTARELVDEFCRALDLPRPSVRLPYAIGRCMALCAEAVFGLLHKPPPISRRSLEFFETNNAFDIKKAARTLDFEPACDLPQGLALTRNWLEQRGMNVTELAAAEVS